MPADENSIFSSLDEIFGDDAGGRGIGALRTRVDAPPPATTLAAAAAAFTSFLTAPDSAGGNGGLLVLTGFPCCMKETPPAETDGLSGAAALCAAAAKLGRPSALVTDACCAGAAGAAAGASPALLNGGHSGASFALHAFPPAAAWDPADTSRLRALVSANGHAIAVERSGRSHDGSYYTMRGLAMDSLVAPLDEALTADCACGEPVDAAPGALPRLPSRIPTRSDLWTSLASPPPATGAPAPPAGPSRVCTAIGDGGNELGMGSALQAVRAAIPLGETIACVVPCDNLLVAGVSNWGAWGLIAAAEASLRLAARRAWAAERAARGSTRDLESGAATAGGTVAARRPSQPSYGGTWLGLPSAATTAGYKSSREYEAASAIAASATTAPPPPPPLPPPPEAAAGDTAAAAVASLPSAILSLLRSQPPGFLLPSREDEIAVAAALSAAGARDGITGALDGSVDGMPLSRHLAVLDALRAVLVAAFSADV